MFTYNTATKTLTHGKAEGVHFHTAEEACDLLTGGQLQDLVEAATGKRPGRYSSKDKAIPHVADALKGVERVMERVTKAPKGEGKVARCWALFTTCASRAEALEKGLAEGLNRGTLATQWQKFRKEKA